MHMLIIQKRQDLVAYVQPGFLCQSSESPLSVVADFAHEFGIVAVVMVLMVVLLGTSRQIDFD